MICDKCLSINGDNQTVCVKCGTPITRLKNMDYAAKFNTKKDWNTVSTAKSRVQSRAQATSNEPEHLIPWLVSSFKKAIATIPKRIKELAIFCGIILAVNLTFWTIDLYFMPNWLRPLRSTISLVVFLTATYNDVVPKTIFWVILFTFGKRLFSSVRKRGFKETFACLKHVVPQYKNAMLVLGNKAYSTLLLGAGFGLMIANNFASYSRFSGARNKFDKYFIMIVIAFTISYLLGEAKKTGIFMFVKLGSKDLGRLIGKGSGLSDNGVYVLLSGFVFGLILDAPLILFKLMYGGYILGAVAVLVAIGLGFTSGKPKSEVKA